MLIIGHRGARGLAPENTLEALHAGMDAGADILEFDVRLTRDNVLVLSHDFHTLRSHRQISLINRLTLTELREKTVDSPITTLEEVLDELFGKIILNIELKGRGSGVAVVKLLKQHAKTPEDWDSVLLSSFWVRELSSARHASPKVKLALLHSLNAFSFIAHHRKLRLCAVGFHRLHFDRLAIQIAHELDLFTYVYTINRPQATSRLASRGIDGIVTDYPNLFQDIER